MTASSASSVEPVAEPDAAFDDVHAAFVAAGWTIADWDDLREFLIGYPQRQQIFEGPPVTYRLQDPPGQFTTPITAPTVRHLFVRYGPETSKMVTLLVAGVPEPFIAAFQIRHPDASAPVILTGWHNAISLNLSAEDATGWAATGYLRTVFSAQAQQAEQAGMDRVEVGILIGAWTDRFGFGPSAYRWVLAGFTLEEAIAIRDAGNTPTDEELRVMAALHDVGTLPAGA